MNAKIKKLKYPQVIALIDMLRAHMATFILRQLRQDEAAKELSGHCGFEVTVTNLQSALQALDIPMWKSKRNVISRDGKMPSLNNRVIARSILFLADEMGATLPLRNELQRLAAIGIE